MMELNIVIRKELVDTILKWLAQYDKGVFFFEWQNYELQIYITLRQ